ncbi:MAG: hypothetical protein HY020_00480 [Burkholderiales bacterium]|nr:hypothetical protein [Burkholderiales bacterium]
MKSALTIRVAMGLAAAVRALLVKGDEAVKDLVDGTKGVEAPQRPKADPAAPCSADNPTCPPSNRLLVETRGGRQERIAFHARPGTCRRTSYVDDERHRHWMVKRQGQRMQRQRPDVTGICVSAKALPTSNVQ